MHNADDIYDFWGNVMHPCGGGFIGQNMFDNSQNSDPGAERSRGVKIAESDDKTLRIYTLRYCRTCCTRIFKLKKE